MKIIENRKLFGKINLIDILIIFIAIAILIFVYMYFGRTRIGAVPSEKYIFQYEMQNVLKETTENVKVGDKVYDNETNAYIGEIVEVNISKYKIRTVNHETIEFVNAEVPDKYNVVVTIQNDLIDTGSDLKTVDDYVIKVGKRVYLRGGLYAGSGYIVFIERQEK